MTSEDKYVLSQLTNETGNLKGILKQQNKIENMASSMLDAVFLLDMLTELKEQDSKNGLELLEKQFHSVFYWEKDEGYLKEFGIVKE